MLERAITLKRQPEIPFDDKQAFVMTTSSIKDRKKPKDEWFQQIASAHRPIAQQVPPCVRHHNLNKSIPTRSSTHALKEIIC